MKETKYYYREDKQKHNIDTKGLNKYYGAFYAKMTNTLNKIKQFNEMVYGDAAGIR